MFSRRSFAYRKLAGVGTFLREKLLPRACGQIGVVFAVLATLTLLACFNDSSSSIFDQLRKNAEEFEYTVGEAGGDLTFTTISEPLTFNLALSTDAGSTGILGYLFEGLTDTSWITGEAEPSLAKSWTSSDDGLTWTFSLRDDVKWHDGESFTAHDVEFTFDRIIYNDEISSSARASFNFRFPDEATTRAKMEVTAIDDHTVRFTLPVPLAPFLRAMGTAIYPKHVLEQHVDNGTFASVWNIQTDPSEIIGTGPFTIERYTPGDRVVLSRNQNYWLKDGAGNSLPYLERVVYLIVPDTETELAKFKAGETDIHGVQGEEFSELESLQEEGNFTIHRRGPGLGSTFLAFNMNLGQNSSTMEPYVAAHKLKWFRNKQFRQAVAHVVDKTSIIRDVQNGLAYPLWSSISPSAGDFHNPDVRRYEYDIARANAILDGLGWVDTDGDGIREDDEGNKITFSLATSSGSSVGEKIGMIIEQGLKEIGVEANFTLAEFGRLVSQLTATYDWEAIIISFTASTDPHYGITLWHSNENLHLWYPNQPQPSTDWEAEIDRLYVEASQELDRDKRIELYHQAQEVIAENVPLIFTTRSERLAALRNVLANTTPTLYGLYDVRYLYRTDL